MHNLFSIKPLLCLFVLTSLISCTQHHALKTPENPSGELYGSPTLLASTVDSAKQDCSNSQHRYAPEHYRVDQIISNSAHLVTDPRIEGDRFNDDLSLSPGDMISILIESGEGFNGNYILNPKGRINLPYLKSIKLQGKDVYQAAEAIELALVRAEFFQASTTAVNVQVLEWAEISVLVSGAVFAPGRQFINRKNKDTHISEKMTAFGDYSSTRLLSEALRSASGIRPDAKIDQVILIRNGWQVEVDMSGVLTGKRVNDIPLISGDRIIVPTSGCFQRHLVRPSQITPKGFRVFISNLIDSAASNANAAVGRFSSHLPYGSRLLQGAISANCIGGKQWTNAPRKVILASNNPITNQYQVIERSVEELMRQAHDEQLNPFLMPNDSIACYDSDVTNIRDVANFMLDLINPIKAF